MGKWGGHGEPREQSGACAGVCVFVCVYISMCVSVYTVYVGSRVREQYELLFAVFCW